MSLESDHDNADPDEVSKSSRQPLVIGSAAAAIAVLGVAAAIALTMRDGEAPAPPTVVATTPGTESEPDEPAEPVEPDPTAFTWQRASLPVPENTRANLIGLATTNEGLIAFGQASDLGASQEVGRKLLVWESDDGASWQLIGPATGITSTARLEQILSHPEGFTAVGMITDPDHPLRMLPVVFNSTDGMTWSEAELTFQSSPGEEVYLSEAAVGSGGMLVGLSVTTGNTRPVLLVEKEGKTLVADANEWTLTITDDAGNVLVESTPERVFGTGFEGEFGLAVRDPETREVLFTLGWERLEGGNPDEVTEDGQRVYVVGEYRLLIDQFDESFVVEDLASGDTLFTGTAEELYRGPAPQFRAIDGEIVLSLSWREVDRAMEELHNDFEEGDGDYATHPVLLHSADGTSFAEVELGDFSSAREAHLNALVGVDGGFTAFGEMFDESFGDPRQVVWKTSDGVDWDSFLPAEMLPYFGSVAAFGGQYLAIGEGEGGQAVLSSPDALTWNPVFEPEQSPNDYTWFSNLVVGELGALIIGESEGPPTRQTASYTALDSGMVLSVESGFVILVDEETSQILLEGYFDQLVEGGRAETADGFVRFYSEDGSLLIEADAGDFSEALIRVEGGEQAYETRASLYLSLDGNSFHDLGSVDELRAMYIHRALVGDQMIVLAGEEMIFEGEGDAIADEGGEGATTTIAAAAAHPPIGPGPGGPPQLIVVVGVPVS